MCENDTLAFFVNKSLVDVATFSFRENDISFRAHSRIKIRHSKVFVINLVQTMIN
jgi:hypothetical protein